MSNYAFLKTYQFKNGVEIKNRIVIPPMTEASSLENGAVSQDELRYFKIHTGGAGMFIAPAANVTALGKGFEGQLSIAEDRFLPGLTRLAETIKHDGTKAILQLYHAGRMSNSAILRGQQTVSASAVAAPRPGSETPRELTEAEIETIITAFGEATRRAIQAGFDGIELHGANTYLLQQFFSPHSNRRTDQWGGTIEKRMAFILKVIASVQTAVCNYATTPFIIGYRISPEELEIPGIRMADTLKLVDVLADQPIDYLHISLGDVWQPSLNDKNDSEPLVLKIKRQLAGRLPIIAVGGLKTPAEVEKVIEAGIDFAALGHESLYEPHWVQKVIADQIDTIRYSIAEADYEELGINLAFREFGHL